MERATLMKTFHGTLKPPTPRDIDASFSSYLQPHHQHHHHTIGSNRCRGLDDSTSELSIFDAHKYFNEATNNDNNIQKVSTTISSSSNSKVSPLVNNTNNMVIEGINTEKGDIITETTRYSSASSSVDCYNSNMRNYKTRSFHAAAATPTASSEASWNSQAGLLSHPPGSIPVSMMTNPPNPNDLNKKIRASLSKPIWFLRKKCPCSGKKSVQVKEKKTQMPPPPPPQRQDHETLATPTPKKPETLNNIVPITPNNWVVATTKSQRFHSQSHKAVTSSSLRDGFTFPVLNPQKNPQEIHEFLPVSTTTTNNNNDNDNNTKQLHFSNGVVEDPARDSLEVFQPPCNNDAIELPQVSPKSRINIMMDEDAHSDASSDLFEIESFSTTTASAATQSTCATCHPVIYRRRDSMDEAPSNNNGFFFCRRSMDERSMTTECYEPSEASIEWSVTTAAAEDESGGGGAVQGHGEKWKRIGSSSLVSCRSEKAVSVGPQPVRAVEGHRGATCSSRHVSVSSSIRAGVSSVNKPPLARAHNTPCMSLAFAT